VKKPVAVATVFFNLNEVILLFDRRGDRWAIEEFQGNNKILVAVATKI